MNICKVYYHSWELECCGHGFKIGDTVKWLVEFGGLYKVSGPAEINDIDYFVSFHSRYWDGLMMLEGVVEKIEVHYLKYKVNDRGYAIPSEAEDAMILPKDKVSNGEKCIDGFRQEGVIATIAVKSIRQACISEVTFEKWQSKPVPDYSYKARRRKWVEDKTATPRFYFRRVKRKICRKLGLSYVHKYVKKQGGR